MLNIGTDHRCEVAFTANTVDTTYPIKPFHLFAREKEWEEFSKTLPLTDRRITAYRLLSLLLKRAKEENGGEYWPYISMEDIKSVGFNRLDMGYIEDDGYEWLKLIVSSEKLFGVTELFVLAVYAPACIW